MDLPEAHFMRMAIERTRQGILNGQSPFGSCIVQGEDIISCEHNLVWATGDITAHAEITAIRAACHATDSIDLSGTVIYSTTEPCPMCFSASHWARIDAIIYGASISDAKQAGFNELAVSNEILKKVGGSRIEIISGFMREECVALFKFWKEHRSNSAY